METSGLNHVILTVSTIERSRAFYGDLLGFSIRVIEGDPDKSFFFACGDAQFSIYPSCQPVRYMAFRDPDNIQLEYWLP